MASPQPSVSFGLGGSVRLGGGQELTPPRGVLPTRAAFALLPKSSVVRWSAYPQGHRKYPRGSLAFYRELGLSGPSWPSCLIRGPGRSPGPEPLVDAGLACLDGEPASLT